MSEQEQINAFVGACHGDMATVQGIANEHPEWIDARAVWEETPLGAASHVGQKEIARFLLSRGATLDICAAALLGMGDEVTAFLDRDPALANARGAHGIGVLFHAVVGDEPGIAALLVDRGGDVNAGGDGVATALHAAASTGNAPLAEWLIARGADVNRTGYDGKTPLATAIESGHGEVAQVFRRHGASK